MEDVDPYLLYRKIRPHNRWSEMSLDSGTWRRSTRAIIHNRSSARL
jgi:hypothetical protein